MKRYPVFYKQDIKLNGYQQTTGQKIPPVGRNDTTLVISTSGRLAGKQEVELCQEQQSRDLNFK